MPATGKYSPWRLWILVVFWVLQYLFLALELAIVIIAIVALSMSDVYYTAGAKASIAIQLVLVLLCLALTIAEPIKLARHTLTPLFYLISNALKSAIWIALTVAGAVVNSSDSSVEYTDSDGYTYRSSYRFSPISIIIAIVLCLLFVLPMIYGSILFHKNRQNRGTYNGVARSDPENLNMGGMGVGTVGNGNSTNEYFAPESVQQPYKPTFQAHELATQNYAPQQQYGHTQPYAQPQPYEPYAGAAVYR